VPEKGIVVDSLLDDLYYKGPQIFSRKRLLGEGDLFKQRGALFYTPTEHLPRTHIGSGPLNVILPIVLPTAFERVEIYSYRIPRLWVDLIQRATGKLRWQPMIPAKVTITRYDAYELGESDMVGGIKAVLEALKVRTSGRYDGRWLYYFGAIEDDNQTCLSALSYPQKRISDPSKAYCRIIVEQA
jgi:hypothetical protein